MGFIKEFKEFAMRGNVLDMAVGVVVGGVILVGLYALFKNVVLVNLNSEITDMFNYTA